MAGRGIRWGFAPNPTGEVVPPQTPSMAKVTWLQTRKRLPAVNNANHRSRAARLCRARCAQSAQRKPQDRPKNMQAYFSAGLRLFFCSGALFATFQVSNANCLSSFASWFARWKSKLLKPPANLSLGIVCSFGD